MAAASLDWQGDFTVDDRGHTVMADDDAAYIQRLVRRLLTTPRLFDQVTRQPIAPPDYVFSPSFGAGVRRLVHRVVVLDEVIRLIHPQLLADPETSHTSRPEITAVMGEGGMLLVNIVVVRVPSKRLIFGIKVSAG